LIFNCKKLPQPCGSFFLADKMYRIDVYPALFFAAVCLLLIILVKIFTENQFVTNGWLKKLPNFVGNLLPSCYLRRPKFKSTWDSGYIIKKINYNE